MTKNTKTPTAPAAPAPAAAPAAPEAPAADAKPEKPAKASKVEREKQNDQTKPGVGTKTRALWDIIDQISAKEGRPATRKEVMDAAETGGFNTAMSASLYSHWRKFHGLTGANAPGRTAKPEVPAASATDETPPAPPAPPAPAA